MRKIFYTAIAGLLVLSSISGKAQAFDKSTKMITIAIGGGDMFHIPVGYNYYTGFYEPLTAQLYVQGEFAVHKYVGVGFDFTLGGRPSNYGYSGYGYYYGNGYGYQSEFNIAAGALANFHFYQLIADKTHKKLHADKLDIYAGLSTGLGMAIHPSSYYNSETNIDVLFYIGPQVGVHYFFNPHIGINGEFGFGKTFISAGVTFKLGGSKGKGESSPKQKQK